MIPPGIDLGAYTPVRRPTARARSSSTRPRTAAKKGTEHVIAACEQLPVELEIVEGAPPRRGARALRAADIVVDQLNAGWYGLFAIEAMALGKPVVTFLHDEAVRRSAEAFGVEVPIVSATKETLVDALRPLVERPDERRRARRRRAAPTSSRSTTSSAIADRLLDLYAGL